MKHNFFLVQITSSIEKYINVFQILTDQKGVWSIKNKYYSCDVNIQVHQQSNNASSQENLKIGGSLWYSDNLKSDKVMERLDQWQKELKAY